MAAMVRSILGARTRFLASQPSLLQRARHSHTQSLWEQILGRKIEPSAVKALEEAFLEFKVSQSVPSWLPFLPNSSFWIPSSEDTMKNLELLAESVHEGPPACRKHAVTSFTASPDLADDGVSSSKALSAIQITDKLLDRFEESPIESGTMILLVDTTDKDDEDDEDYEGDEDEEEEGEEEVGIPKVTKV